MVFNRAALLVLTLWIMTATGCGFGGFTDNAYNDATSANQPKSDTDTKITGVVSKGLFKDGTVRIYALNTDGSEILLKTSKIGAFGNYSSRISAFKVSSTGSYNGVVLIKAAGSYFDEATGTLQTIDDEHPLRAVIANPSGTFTASVTPLTELAARKALAVQQGGKSLAASDVTAANALISGMFKVDIIGTLPVEPDLTSAGFANAATSQEQKDYTLALAGISQMARDDAGALAGTLNALSSDIADGTMSVESVSAFQSALTAFVGSDKNATGVTTIRDTNLVSAGGTTKTIRIGTAEKTGAGSLIRGITVTLLLPPGVTVKADFAAPEKREKEPLQGVLTASGNVAAGTYLKAAYTPSSAALPGMITLSLASANGFVPGEFVTIKCDVAAGLSPAISDFTIYKNADNPADPKNFKAVDGNGAPFPPEILSVEILPE